MLIPVLNGVFWYIGQVHCGIDKIGLFTRQPKKGRWGRLGSMFNWLFSRKPKEDGGRLPDETDEEMEERMIEERRKSSVSF